LAKQFGMIHGKLTPVSQINIEWLKGPSLVQLTQLVDGHARIRQSALSISKTYNRHCQARLLTAN